MQSHRRIIIAFPNQKHRWSMKRLPQRLCIYPKDIVKITGKSERFSRDLIERIKISLNKKAHQFVTIEEFCNYSGLKEERVKELIRD